MADINALPPNEAWGIGNPRKRKKRKNGVIRVATMSQHKKKNGVKEKCVTEKEWQKERASTGDTLCC